MEDIVGTESENRVTELINQYLSVSVPAASETEPPDINTTEDIALSTPFMNLVRGIAHESATGSISIDGVKSMVRLPFNGYTNFVDNVEGHKFKILVTHQDVSRAAYMLRRYEGIYELYSSFSVPAGMLEHSIIRTGIEQDGAQVSANSVLERIIGNLERVSRSSRELNAGSERAIDERIRALREVASRNDISINIDEMMFDTSNEAPETVQSGSDRVNERRGSNFFLVEVAYDGMGSGALARNYLTRRVVRITPIEQQDYDRNSNKSVAEKGGIYTFCTASALVFGKFYGEAFSASAQGHPCFMNRYGACPNADTAYTELQGTTRYGESRGFRSSAFTRATSLGQAVAAANEGKLVYLSYYIPGGYKHIVTVLSGSNVADIQLPAHRAPFTYVDQFLDEAAKLRVFHAGHPRLFGDCSLADVLGSTRTGAHARLTSAAISGGFGFFIWNDGSTDQTRRRQARSRALEYLHANRAAYYAGFPSKQHYVYNTYVNYNSRASDADFDGVFPGMRALAQSSSQAPSPAQTLSEISAASANFIPSQLSSMPSVFQFTGAGRQVVLDNLTATKGLVDTITPSISSHLFRKFYNYFSDDLSHDVESLHINYVPGISTTIPIEGEQAPVVQSTGGRQVDVTITLKKLNPVAVAKLATMFRVSNAGETLVSMLTLARSSYGTGNDRSRMKYVWKAMQIDQLRRSIETLSGTVIPGEFDEPVHIENEVLNSIGLDTFMPYSMEVRTEENISGAALGTYTIVLTFRYINLRNRVEPLQKWKSGNNATVLPQACALSRTYGGAARAVDELLTGSQSSRAHLASSNITSRFKTASAFGTLSLYNGLASFLPVYALYKLDMLKSMTVQEVERRAVELATMLGDTSDETREIARTVSWTYGNMGPLFVTLPDVIGKSNRLQQVGERINASLGRHNSIRATGSGSTVSLSKFGRGVGVFDIAILALECGVSLVQTVSSAVGDPGRTGLRPEYRDRSVINIAALTPLLIYDLLINYLAAYEQGGTAKIEEFIGTISERAEAFVTSATYVQDITASETGVGALDVDLGKRFVGTVNGQEQELCGQKLLVINEIGTVDRESPVFLGAEIELLATGLSSLRNDLTGPNAGATVISRFIDSLTLISVLALQRRTSGSFGMAMRGSLEKTSGEIVTTCRMLQQDQTARAHVRELLVTTCTLTGLDQLAALIALRGFDPSTLAAVPQEYRGLFSSIQEAALTVRQTLTGAGYAAGASEQSVDEAVATLSGMFVDDAFGDFEFRKAFLRLMRYHLSIFQHIASCSSVPGGSALLASRGIQLKVSYAKIYEQVNGYTYTRDAVLGYAANFLINLIHMGLLGAIFTIAGKVILAVASALVAKVLIIISVIVAAIYGIYIFVKTFILNRDGVVASMVRYPNLMTLSRWLAARIRDGIDGSSIMEMCYLSSIWAPSALTASSDAIDTTMSSYLDYPTVILGGITMPPDYFVCKVGFLADSFQELRNSMMQMVEFAEDDERTQSMDFGTLLSEMLNRLNRIRDESAQGLSTRVTESVQAIVQLLRMRGAGNNLPDQLLALLRSFNLAVLAAANITSQQAARGSYGLCNISIIVRGGNTTRQQSYHEKYALYDLRIELPANPLEETQVTMTPRASSIRNLRASTNSTERANYSTLLDASMPSALQNLLMMPNPPTRLALRSDIVDFAPLLCALYMAISDHLNENFRSGIAIAGMETMPDTIGYLMLLKSLVGSSMKAVGRSGVALMKNQLEEMSVSALHRAGAFRAGYIYPTVKLYFIDEDMESWYLYDDLYSYGSILSVQVHGDRHSAVSFAVVRLSNIMGKLTNVMADKVNHELNFWNAPSEDTPICGMMLRVGCRIKIQAGNSPYLTEENTIFTGEISSIVPDKIITIEAQSHGAAFLEDLTTEKSRVFGSMSGLGPVGLASEALGEGAGLVYSNARPESSSRFQRGMKTIRDLIASVGFEVTARSGKLDDYTIVPGLSVDMNGSMRLASDELLTAIRSTLVAEFSESFIHTLGLDVNVHFNNQFLENVDPSGDKNGDSILYWVSSAGWLSFNESAWDILQEMNQLFPNNILTVRPYDTRGTLVWGDPDGYYRFRRGGDVRSAVSDMLIRQLKGFVQGNALAFEPFLRYLRERLSGTPDKPTLALFTYITHVAQELMGGLSDPTAKLLSTTVQGSDRKVKRTFSYSSQFAVGWLANTRALVPEYAYGQTLAQCFTKMENAASVYGELMRDAFNSGRGEFAGEVRHLMTTNVVEKYGSHDIKYLVMIMACDLVLRHILAIAYTRSTSYRKISQLHMKASGRDIIKNDIALQQPYNAIRVSAPENRDAEAVLSPTGSAREWLIRAHYKIKPYALKVYSTYLKNARAFPELEASTISTFAVSTMANLLKETYGGSLLLLGDPRIRENDRILIWDHNHDTFGIVGVRSYVFSFSPTEGCITRVVPDMVTRSQYSLSASNIESCMSLAEFAINGYLAWQSIKAIGHTARDIVRFSRFRSILSGTGAGARMETWLSQRRIAGRAAEWAGVSSRIRGRVNPGRIVIDGTSFEQRTMSDTISHISERVTTVRAGIESRMLRMGERIFGSSRTLPSSVLGESYVIRNPIDTAEFARLQQQISDDIVGGFISGTGLGRGVSGVSLEELTRGIPLPNTELSDVLRRTGMAGQIEEAFVRRLAWDISGSTTVLREGQQLTRTQVYEILAPRIASNYHAGAMEAAGTVLHFNRVKRIYQESAEAFQQMEQGLRRSGMTGQELRQAVGELQGYRQAISDTVQGRATGMTSLLRNIVRTASTYFLKSLALRSLFEVSRWWVDFYLVNQMTADNVVISPLMFRGEPFVAGLEGMTKGEARDISTDYFGTIMNARFADTFEMIKHIGDPIAEGRYRAAMALMRSGPSQ